MNRILIGLVCIPFFALAQTTNGVNFENYENWPAVLEDAKAQNKYVFVDCYTTWCGPCKWMDQNVFSNEKVGQAVNEKFIAVKLQIDSTGHDNENVKKWYDAVARFKSKYNINSFPCYLFFSPTGDLIHRAGNAAPVDEFIGITKRVLDSNYQYYTLLSKYQQGYRDYKMMPYLADGSKLLGHEDLAQKIALDYKQNYLDKANESALLNKEVLDFVTGDFFSMFYNEGSKGRFFKLFMKDSVIIDSIQKHPGFSLYVIKSIIKKEELYDKLYSNDKIIVNNPDWNKYQKSISKKYGNIYLNELLFPAQMEYYNKKRDWKNYVGVLEKQIKLHPPKSGPPQIHVDTDPFQISDAWALNSVAWNLFLHCNETDILKKALNWVDIAIELEKPDSNVQVLDTKANLLYKLGHVADAIALENKALVIDQNNARKNGKDIGENFDSFNNALNKMRKGEPTWSTR